MRAGRLNKRVTLQRPSSPQDETGQAAANYTDVKTVSAGIEPLRGDEFFEAAKHSSMLTHKVILRYFKGLDATWRVVYGQRVFAITSVIDVGERHREMNLMCREMPSGEVP